MTTSPQDTSGKQRHTNSYPEVTPGRVFEKRWNSTWHDATAALDFIGGLAPAEKTKNDEIMYYSEVFRLHGVPKVIISDRDRLFRAALWREMHELMGTKLAYTSPYYPQSDGNTERVNRTLVAMLKVYTEQLPAFHNRHVALLCEPRMPPQTTDHTEPTIELQARRGQNGVPVDSRSSRWATRCS
eukprot:GHVS01066588.1.p1 GENE.GHVS01066588.1~~GHVS01066588.1.p1  ORF type:complete len:185 (-),score=5.54 GHVS01066588.1:409-963(-)